MFPWHNPSPVRYTIAMYRIATFLSPLALSLAALSLPSQSAHASNYPPSYDICSVDDVVDSSEFSFVKDTVRFNGHAKLSVSYRGYLLDLYPAEEIEFYVKLNGQDTMLPASAGSYGDAYVILDSGPRSCSWCGPNMPYNPPICEGVEFPDDSSGQWACANPTPTEDYMFFWAFNQWGKQNAWDIEVAAHAHGQWDSLDGNNYSARFEARNSCY